MANNENTVRITRCVVTVTRCYKLLLAPDLVQMGLNVIKYLILN